MLLKRIERFLSARKMTPTRFGREAIGDPNLVEQLHHGRELRVATQRRVLDYLDENELGGV